MIERDVLGEQVIYCIVFNEWISSCNICADVSNEMVNVCYVRLFYQGVDLDHGILLMRSKQSMNKIERGKRKKKKKKEVPYLLEVRRMYRCSW